MSPLAWSGLAIAGAIGAQLRFLVDRAVQARAHGAFPWGILVVNTAGSLLLGVLVGLGLHHGLGRSTQLVLGTGFCGAFTTYSTFAYETVRLVEGGARGAALRNIGLTLVTGSLAAAAGLTLATAF